MLTLFVQSKRDRAKNPRWISKGQNLVAYSSIGIYFGRAKAGGSLKYESLRTKERKVAERRLLKFMARIRRMRDRHRDSEGIGDLKFRDLFDRYRKVVEDDLALKPASKKARIHALCQERIH